jgi:cell division protein FtsB
MKRNIFVSFLFLLLGISGIIAFSYYSYRESKRSSAIDKEIDTLEQEAGKIKKDNKELEGKIAYFETEYFEEDVAKEKLNLQKPDEHVIIIKPSPSLDTDIEENIEENRDPKDSKDSPNYIKWWNYFFE